MTNKRSIIGVDEIYYALVTEDDSGAYAAGTPVYLAPAMTVSMEPAMNAKTQYADNQPFDQLAAEGVTKITCEITGIEASTLATLLGMTYDVTNARVFDSIAIPPYIALGFRAMKSDSTYRYYWFLKGRFSKPKEEMVSRSETADMKTVTLEFNALKTIYQFMLVSGGLTDGVKRVFGETSDTSFVATSWFTSVQYPQYGTPSALSCTPSPANGATGVSVSVAPTLTFNNALATGVAGILLTKNDGTVVTATITINAANKVVTITPGSSLSASSTYLITLSGVKDVFGQSFAQTVYHFSTT